MYIEGGKREGRGKEAQAGRDRMWVTDTLSPTTTTTTGRQRSRPFSRNIRLRLKTHNLYQFSFYFTFILPFFHSTTLHPPPVYIKNNRTQPIIDKIKTLTAKLESNAHTLCKPSYLHTQLFVIYPERKSGMPSQIVE